MIQPPPPARLCLAALLVIGLAALYGIGTDGQRVARPTAPPAAAGAPGASAAATLLWNGRLDLDTAGPEDLAALPGIGPVRAQKILAVRAARGGRFESVDDLLDVPGIGKVTLERLRPHVRVGEGAP